MSKAADLGGADCPLPSAAIFSFTENEEDDEVTQSLVHLYEICSGLGLH